MRTHVATTTAATLLRVKSSAVSPAMLAAAILTLFSAEPRLVPHCALIPSLTCVWMAWTSTPQRLRRLEWAIAERKSHVDSSVGKARERMPGSTWKRVR